MSVIRVTDPKARKVIEDFTDLHTRPDVIRFVQDGNGDWIVGEEVLSDLKFIFDKVNLGETKETVEAKLKVEVKKELIIKDDEYSHVTDLLQKYGEVIDYVPIRPEPETPEVEPEKTDELSELK
jgi:hypothetical protein